MLTQDERKQVASGVLDDCIDAVSHLILQVIISTEQRMEETLLKGVGE